MHPELWLAGSHVARALRLDPSSDLHNRACAGTAAAAQRGTRRGQKQTNGAGSPIGLLDRPAASLRFVCRLVVSVPPPPIRSPCTVPRASMPKVSSPVRRIIACHGQQFLQISSRTWHALPDRNTLDAGQATGDDPSKGQDEPTSSLACGGGVIKLCAPVITCLHRLARF
jgi:hypothetical protein